MAHELDRGHAGSEWQLDDEEAASVHVDRPDRVPPDGYADFGDPVIYDANRCLRSVVLSEGRAARLCEAFLDGVSVIVEDLRATA